MDKCDGILNNFLRRFTAMRAATIVLQKFCRGLLARKKVGAMKKLQAVVVIQSGFRCWRLRAKVSDSEFLAAKEKIER